MIRGLLFSIFLLLASCSNYGQLTYVAKLPHDLEENSGIVSLDPGSVWIIEDSGNKDRVYEVDLQGNLLRDYKVKNAKNDDWEDLAADPEGNLYIADIGNNSGKRKELVIYKIPDPRIEPGDKIEAEKIRFSYPKKLPDAPGKDFPHPDAEALFYHQGYLYIITKNRDRPFSGVAYIFRLPAHKGHYKADYMGHFIPCSEEQICQVTAADLSPDGKKLALLGYGKLWVLNDFDGADIPEDQLITIDLGATTQLESVCFLDENTLLLSDEQTGATGRNLYRYTLPY